LEEEEQIFQSSFNIEVRRSALKNAAHAYLPLYFYPSAALGTAQRHHNISYPPFQVTQKKCVLTILSGLFPVVCV
jgi:hypothetical protein